MNNGSKKKINLRFVIFRGILIAGVIALCVWGCISTYKATRLVYIQCFEEPIRDFKILGYDEKVSRPTRNTYDGGEEVEKTSYMYIEFERGIYKVEIQSLGSMFHSNPKKYKLYYDEKTDEVYMFGYGMIRVALTLFFIALIIFLIWKIRRNTKKTKSALPPA